MTFENMCRYYYCVHIKLDSYILTNLEGYRHHFANHGGLCREVGSHCPNLFFFHHRANFKMYVNAINNGKMWSKILSDEYIAAS